MIHLRKIHSKFAPEKRLYQPEMCSLPTISFPLASCKCSKEFWGVFGGIIFWELKKTSPKSGSRSEHKRSDRWAFGFAGFRFRSHHRQLKLSTGIHTLPETNSSPLKMVVSNRNLLFQGSIFRGYVSYREGKSGWKDPGPWNWQQVKPSS